MKHVPLVSPYGLIQESLWPNEWLILVSCMMLNQTQRKQVERVLPEFIRRWPTPATFLSAQREDVVDLLRPLGFYNRRTDNLFKMTERYVAAPWQHVRELPGIGEYAARAWEIFVLGELGEDPPKDHALVKYHAYAMARSHVLRQESPDVVTVTEETHVGCLPADVAHDPNQVTLRVPCPAA